MEPFEFESAYRTSKDKVIGGIVLLSLFLLEVIVLGGLIIYGINNDYDIFIIILSIMVCYMHYYIVPITIRKKFKDYYEFQSFIGNYTKSKCVLDQHGLHLAGKHGVIVIPVEGINKFEEITTAQGRYYVRLARRGGFPGFEDRVDLILNASKYQILINTPVQENDDFMSAFYKKLDEIADVTDKAMNVER